MPSVTQREPTEFFVVGGPVQAERPCYVERTADSRLLAVLRAKRLCCVLGPRATGKSSLLRRAARALRNAGTLVAFVDLKRAEHGDGAASAEPRRDIAARIAAELDLGVDVAAWWSARKALADDKLVAFFWEVVLTNTTAPVVVLVDEVDGVLESPLAGELLAAIAECYQRRSREPDFGRLGFALAGCTSQRVLAEESGSAALAECELIEPEDFRAEQAYRLAAAFGGDQELAQALMDRICAWTGGHPYLTQRVARGVARKGGRLEDVERVVRDQLLAPGAADSDPVLSHARAWLGEPSRTARRATRLLAKVCAGGNVSRPADASVWERLWLSGTVRVDDEGRLRARNRVVKELVAARWLKTKGGGWRSAAAAAVVVAALAAGGYWYTQRLPVADIATLTSATAEPSAVEDAYRRLRDLPGFAQRAEELWLEALGRQSRAATTLAAAMAADTRLRGLPGQTEAADRLLGEFWLRRARAAAHAEQRDLGVLLVQRAAALPGEGSLAASYLAELVGDDYRRLERSLRLATPPDYWHMMFAQAALVSIDAEHQALRTPFGAAAGSAALASEPVRLTALQHVALVRELGAEGEGTAGEFELSLSLQHAAARELLVTLTAPSGAEAAVTIPRGDGSLVETFSFRAVPGSSLAQLADEGVRGVWRLTVVDRAAGNTGVLAGWGLTFGDVSGRDDVPEGAELLAIPDPRRVDAVNVRAVAETAVAWPVSPGAVGSVALWNLATGLNAHDFTLPSAPRQVALDATGTRVLAATDRALLLWDAVDGALVARVTTTTEFVLPPVFSPDGGYVAIAERVDGASPLYSFLRSADGSLLSTIEGLPDVDGWELGAGARYVALLGEETVIRVIETRRGGELARLTHEQAVERLLHSADGATLVTVDRDGTVAAWPVTGALRGRERPLGHTAAAGSASLSADGGRLAYARDDGAIAVLDVEGGAELYRLRIPRAAPVTTTRLSADGTELVTQSGAVLKSWSLPGRPAAGDRARADAVPTALALDRTSDLVGVGLESGQLIVTGVDATAQPALAYFGHRGPVTAVALNRPRGIAATGGRDGIVRIWDIASGAPTGTVMQPADAPIAAVALSADGRYVASAAGSIVRTAAVADGRVVADVATEGAATAVAFAPDAALLAVADGARVVIMPLETSRSRAIVRLDAAATALAFTDGGVLAIGDASGAITLFDTVASELTSTIRHWSQPIRWLGFSPDGSALLVATDAWLHALAAATRELTPAQSRLVVWPADAAEVAAISSTAAGFAGVAIDGSVVSGVLDLVAAEAAADPALVARDWQAAFALRLNDNGEPVPFDP